MLSKEVTQQLDILKLPLRNHWLVVPNTKKTGEVQRFFIQSAETRQQHLEQADVHRPFTIRGVLTFKATSRYRITFNQKALPLTVIHQHDNNALGELLDIEANLQDGYLVADKGFSPIKQAIRKRTLFCILVDLDRIDWMSNSSFWTTVYNTPLLVHLQRGLETNLRSFPDGLIPVRGRIDLINGSTTMTNADVYPFINTKKQV